MEKTVTNESISKDVLHIPSQSKLTPEEIAKALAHHKRHHHDEPPAQSAPGKKNK